MPEMFKPKGQCCIICGTWFYYSDYSDSRHAHWREWCDECSPVGRQRRLERYRLALNERLRRCQRCRLARTRCIEFHSDDIDGAYSPVWPALYAPCAICGQPFPKIIVFGDPIEFHACLHKVLRGHGRWRDGPAGDWHDHYMRDMAICRRRRCQQVYRRWRRRGVKSPRDYIAIPLKDEVRKGLYMLTHYLKEEAKYEQRKRDGTNQRRSAQRAV